jgi:hypothetical protein
LSEVPTYLTAAKNFLNFTGSPIQPPLSISKILSKAQLYLTRRGCCHRRIRSQGEVEAQHIQMRYVNLVFIMSKGVLYKKDYKGNIILNVKW